MRAGIEVNESIGSYWYQQRIYIKIGKLGAVLFTPCLLVCLFFSRAHMGCVGPCACVSVYYRKNGSASYIVREVLSVREREREREIQRETDGSNVTIVEVKLAMNSHFPLPKIRTFRFSLHTSRLSLHGEVTIVGLKFAMSSHFPLPKKFSPSLFPLFQMARAARRVGENPRQMIKSCPVLFCSSQWKKESN